MAGNIVPFPRRGTNDNFTDPNPPQPGLRSFIVYNEAPDGCLVHEVADRAVEPHLRQGEFALIDTSDCEPTVGDLFLIQWSTGARALVELEYRTFRFWNRGAEAPEPGEAWLVIMQNEIMSLGSGSVTPVRWADGPYYTNHLREKLIGRVVGILEPNFLPMLPSAA